MAASDPGGSDLPWFPFYVRDFTRSRFVRSLSPAETGIYVLLLCEQWENGPLPDDQAALANLCGVDGDAMADAWQRLRHRFNETDEGWVNPRLQTIRSEQARKRRQKQRAGMAGAKARWEQGENGNRMASPKHRHSDANADAMQDTESEEESDTEEEEIVEADASMSDGDEPHRWMHEMWHDELGIEGHRIKLTDTRRSKYRALWDEQLSGTKDPKRAYRMILKRVQVSDHHMSERSYQMPESLFRNAERRETWIQRTLDAARKGTSNQDQKRRRISQAIDEMGARNG